MRLQISGDFRRRSTEALDMALSASDPVERASFINQAVFWHERAVEAEDAALEAEAPLKVNG